MYECVCVWFEHSFPFHLLYKCSLIFFLLAFCCFCFLIVLQFDKRCSRCWRRALLLIAFICAWPCVGCFLRTHTHIHLHRHTRTKSLALSLFFLNALRCMCVCVCVCVFILISVYCIWLFVAIKTCSPTFGVCCFWSAAICAVAFDCCCLQQQHQQITHVFGFGTFVG